MELVATNKDEVEGLIYFNPTELRTKEFNAFVDRLLIDGSADEAAFATLTPVQRQVFSVLNRAIARITAKLSDSTYEYQRYIDSE